jgi:hypothetical protein
VWGLIGRVWEGIRIKLSFVFRQSRAIMPQSPTVPIVASPPLCLGPHPLPSPIHLKPYPPLDHSPHAHYQPILHTQRYSSPLKKHRLLGPRYSETTNMGLALRQLFGNSRVLAIRICQLVKTYAESSEIIWIMSTLQALCNLVERSRRIFWGRNDVPGFFGDVFCHLLCFLSILGQTC